MVSQRNQILFSKAATARLFKVAAQKVREIRETIGFGGKVIWIWIAGQRPRFVSPKVYRQEFVDFRKAAGRTLAIVGRSLEYHGETFLIQSASSPKPYTVEARQDGIFCNCEDMANLLDRFGKGACKHVYAALFALNHNSLSDYLAAQPEIPQPSQAPTPQPTRRETTKTLYDGSKITYVNGRSID